MPLLLLTCKVNMSGVDKFRVPPGGLLLDLKMGAGDEVRERVEVGEDEVSIKFAGESKPCTISRVDVEDLAAFEMADLRLNRMTPVAAFKCDGCEPVRWHPTGPYVAETEEGERFDVSFDGANDWHGYSNATGQALSIDRTIEHDFILHTGSPAKKH